jgi:hypothetical protein
VYIEERKNRKMSQSDYIELKKIATELKINKFSPIFGSQEYTDFTKYSLENNVSNTKTTYNRLIPASTQVIFSMERNNQNCPTFINCNNTNTRTNRRPLIGLQIPARPSRPLAEKTLEKMGLLKTIKQTEICLCNITPESKKGINNPSSWNRPTFG